MKAKTLKQIFNDVYSKMLLHEECITSKKGNDTFMPNNEETFKQIYVSSNDKTSKYKKFRNDISERYFIGSKGTLLKLNNKNEIKLIENIDKKSTRRSYSIYFKSLKKAKTIRDYQLVAICYESHATIEADKLLKEKGVEAFKYGVEVHHIKGLDFDDASNLNITLNPQHTLLHSSAPKKVEDEIVQLLKISEAFGNCNKPTLVMTEQKYDKNILCSTKNDSKYSFTKSIENKEDIDTLQRVLNENYFNIPGKIIPLYFEDEICYLYIDINSKTGKVLNSNRKILYSFSKEVLETMGFI